MFRYEDGKDISQDEFNTIVTPFIDICDAYLENELMPIWVSFYLAEGFKHSALWQTSFDIHINSALDMFNRDCKDINSVKEKVKTILLKKYKLKVINENPLDFIKIS